MAATTDYSAQRKVLRLVHELHVRGYQRIRIAPGMSASGLHWRCSITPVTNIARSHGARAVDHDQLTARYTSADRCEYFGWKDAAHLSPSRLANLFVSRYPEIAAAGRGRDWLYVGWYVEMLHFTYPDAFPYAYSDWDDPDDHLPTVGGRDLRLPLPPPGEAP